MVKPPLDSYIGLIAGSYSCVITDALGCSFTSPTVTVTQPLALTATSSFTDVSCDGGSDGTATVTPTGGTLPYIIYGRWSNLPDSYRTYCR